jgi:hypothetical protein
MNLGLKNITLAFRVTDNNGIFTLEDSRYGYWSI